MSKSNPFGLTFLPIPYAPCLDINMDFILGLPRTKHVHDSIFFIVDRLSKMAHFIPCHKMNDASHILKLVCRDIVGIHGFPKALFHIMTSNS
jgi:hypothetical protein